jgi:hypothetical protein
VADQPDDDDKITHHIPLGPENRQPTSSTPSKRGETNAEKIENSPHDLTFKISPLQVLRDPCRRTEKNRNRRGIPLFLETAAKPLGKFLNSGNRLQPYVFEPARRPDRSTALDPPHSPQDWGCRGQPRKRETKDSAICMLSGAPAYAGPLLCSQCIFRQHLALATHYAPE